MAPVQMTDKQQMGLPMAVLLGKGTLGGRLVPEQRYERVRPDSLPEHTRYRDDGCEVNPSCLTCPLPRCRYDEPGGLRGLVNSYRDGQMMEQRNQGASVELLAESFGVSRRTVFRVLGSAVSQRREARCA